MQNYPVMTYNPTLAIATHASRTSIMVHSSVFICVLFIVLYEDIWYVCGLHIKT